MENFFSNAVFYGITIILMATSAYAAKNTASNFKMPVTPVTKVTNAPRIPSVQQQKCETNNFQQTAIPPQTLKTGNKALTKQTSSFKFSQFTLLQGKAEYRFESPFALEFMKAFNVGGSEKSRICFSVFPGRNNTWNLKIDILDAGTPVLQYRVQMDAHANVTKERITSIEYVESQRTAMEKFTFRNIQKKRKTNVEDLTVSVEKQLILGTSKILRRYKNGKLTNELSVAPDEIITTFGQIVVFMGTVENIPPNGVKLRWTADGKPLPVLLKKSKNSAGGYIYAVYRADNMIPDSLKNKPILKFYIPLGRGFQYPNKIAMDINGTDLEIVKK